MKHTTLTLAAMLLASQAVCNAVAETIPFPAALDAAAVVQDRVDDIGKRAVVLGNGDLNALLWEDRGAICLRMTENDLWDARIDTSEDPPLLKMDLRNRTWSGGASRVPSWSDRPYPQPRCAARLVIGQPAAGLTGWQRVREQGTQNVFTCRDGVLVMGLTGNRGASSGYRYEVRDLGRLKCEALKLRVSGTSNARYYVSAPGIKGEWRDTPAEPTEIAFPFRAADPFLELYIMTTDGQPAENRFQRIWFEGEGQVKDLDLRSAGVPLAEASRTETLVRSARLDLRRAVTCLTDKHDEQTTVRALADRNVFLIESPSEISLEEILAPQLPPARSGETDGVKWLHMTMPGDVDYPGMEYALAVATQGKRKAVSLVTSFDTREPVLDAACRLARETVASDPASLVARHEADWQQFWSASGVELGDRFFQDAWYRNLYYLRCFCRAGTAMPITLYAGLANDRPGWHGAPTLDYNIEQVFWPMFVCNQVDLMEPYVHYLAAFAPRGRWLAQETYGVNGLFYPVNIFGPEHLVAPEAAKSRNHRQICYVPWSYGLGLTGWGLQNLWLRYKYQPDRAYLESVYPLLRDGAEFYANVLELCHDDGRGKAEIGPSYNPEHGPFGTFNNPVDIAYFRFLFGAAAEAARLLDRDPKAAERWLRLRARVPDYETTPLDGQPIVANWKGATADSVQVHNVAVPTVPIFPADQVTWFSPPEEKALFERTLRWLKHNGNNSHIMVNVARARFSLPEAYTETRAHFSNIVTSNGLYAGWPGHGYYLAESWAFAGLTAELLLQSVGDIIRVFPAWPQEQDAKFANLRAQGGFLVSAEQRGGRVVKLEIVSTVGGKLRLLNPWTGQLVERETQPSEKLEIKP